MGTVGMGLRTLLDALISAVRTCGIILNAILVMPLALWSLRPARRVRCTRVTDNVSGRLDGVVTFGSGWRILSLERWSTARVVRIIAPLTEGHTAGYTLSLVDRAGTLLTLTLVPRRCLCGYWPLQLPRPRRRRPCPRGLWHAACCLAGATSVMAVLLESAVTRLYRRQERGRGSNRICYVSSLRAAWYTEVTIGDGPTTMRQLLGL